MAAMGRLRWFCGLVLLIASVSVSHGWAQEATTSSASAPVLVKQMNPSYSEQARAAKISGDVLVQLVVDANGNPTDVRVKRGLGYGLDEKAVEAVQGYKFRPAVRDGVPVPTKLFVNVNFKIF